MADLPCNTPCPKCGSSDVYREFFAQGERIETKAYDKNPFPKFCSGQCWAYTTEREFIKHHCRCCQYEWAAQPLKVKKVKRSQVTQKGDV